MRITFVLPHLSLAGGNRVVAIYAKRLQDRGHTVRAISYAPRSRNLFHRLKLLLREKRVPPREEGQPYFNDLGITVDVISKLKSFGDADVPDADVVIATWWETAEWISKLSVRKGVKAYLVQHHEIFPYLPVERCHATYRLPLRKIVISRWLKETMESVYGDRSTFLIFNSVETDQFFAPARDKQKVPTLGFLYSTADFKDPQTLLDALARLKAQVPTLKAIAFGAYEVAAQYPLPEWVEFHCQPRQDHLRTLYASCDVWLCASKSEGFHLPPLEAMACRCPVVSTRVGGPMDIIQEGSNGYLVDVGDASALTDRLLDVLNMSNDRWKLMSSAALETATSYTWDDAARLFEKALRDILRSAAD